MLAFCSGVKHYWHLCSDIQPILRKWDETVWKSEGRGSEARLHHLGLMNESVLLCHYVVVLVLVLRCTRSLVPRPLLAIFLYNLPDNIPAWPAQVCGWNLRMKSERLPCTAAAVTAQTWAAKRLQSPRVLGPIGSCGKPIRAFRKLWYHPGCASLMDLHYL